MKLVIRASSATLQHRLERAAAYMLPRMPESDAAFVARTCQVYAVDVGSHSAFVMGHRGADDPLRGLVEERERQSGHAITSDPLFIVTIAAGLTSLVDVLAHELAHVVRQDPLAARGTPDDENEVERLTDQLAQSWLASPPRESAS